MRCKNCGWQNPDTAPVCEKCHSKLNNTYNPNRPRAARPGDERDLGRTPTVMGKANPFAASPDTPHDRPSPSTYHNQANFSSKPASQGTSQRPAICPDCGYPLSDRSDSCPNCGKQIEIHDPMQNAGEEKNSPDSYGPLKGTILSSNPFLFPEATANDNISQGDYSLQPVDENGQPYDEPMLINEGDTIVIGNERFLFTKIRR
ncbi:MAG: zinc-ribbon domain-containing protein [Muribaculaceae bacterium]|nr:zinc-ribbon domain-containing protein [Muribaculaceae bacterium]